jgi:hypothetical protein
MRTHNAVGQRNLRQEVLAWKEPQKACAKHVQRVNIIPIETYVPET